ncbi:hypothetical protein ccbrp13_25020 [Ktedonobacteria bacterium brp13]|nr:hypothetical protein ccbrp13_25020 [Ktedonobacteria bacterium brp13]
MSTIHVFGIRHHGPGCARHLRAALEQLQPDIVLVEGPPDAQETLPLMMSAEMRPPVALLIYTPEHPGRAVYYPFTSFSPEWQALNYALSNSIPARFMDLPQAFQLGIEEEHAEVEATETASEPGTRENAELLPTADEKMVHEDPLSLLARAAGYEDQELWWERMVERRQNSVDLFESILEAMSALREGKTPSNEREARREAYMRQTIRGAQKEGFQRIAVVCGAYHAPVLVEPGPARADNALLKGLKKTKIAATWIPWTNSRLAYRSGYGAGVESPGWYAHLWTTAEQVTARWITRAARLLRQEGLDASSASVIEAVRLSETLATLRDQPQPGLAEHTEAILTVLCHGEQTPMQLIRTRLEIGEEMGQVPPEAPTVPLLRDLEEQKKRLRLVQSVEKQQLDLDLRKENDLARSHLLYRLSLLNINWGIPYGAYGTQRTQGSFHEYWTLQWQVEFIVALIEANIYGSTIVTAAAGSVREQASKQEELPALTNLLDKTILAELPAAIDHVLQAIQIRATLTSDIQHLMDALPALARIVHYRGVRKTRAEHVQPIIDGLFERSLIGLPGACCALNADSARSMLRSINNVQDCVQLLDQAEQRQQWLTCLHSLSEQDNMHGLIRGRACYMLLEQQALAEEELQRLAAFSLSPSGDTEQAAAWIEGFLSGNALLLLHQDQLWRLLDRWLNSLSPAAFIAQLPILRRTFALFQPPERNKMGEKVKHLYRPEQGPGSSNPTLLDEQRAALVLPVLAQIMGVTYEQ